VHFENCALRWAVHLLRSIDFALTSILSLRERKPLRIGRATCQIEGLRSSLNAAPK
jgi:hypothetical protein